MLQHLLAVVAVVLVVLAVVDGYLVRVVQAS
jgi:preprotein translocase subunit SecE